MTTEPQLESYLAKLDKALGQIPICDRADIITELKSHILDVKSKDASVKMSDVLASLGEPESVASRYLLERGLKPAKPSKNPMIKWLTIGFLGTFGITCLTILALIWKFTPLISVDEESERVILLGGVIDVDGKAGKVKIGSASIHKDENLKVFEGSKEISPKEFNEISIEVTNGKLDIEPSVDQQFRWRCKFDGEQNWGFVAEEKKKFKIDLRKQKSPKCNFELPSGVAATILGTNGKINVSRPQSALAVQFTNGKVNIQPDPSKKYRYDIKAVHAAVDNLDSSDATDAIPISIHLVNGKITRE